MAGQDDHFDADWLALREPVDHAARSVALAGRLDDWLRGRDPVRIVDLGAGRGSNLRWLAPKLDAAQRWLLVDHDAELLRAAERGPRPQGCGGQAVAVETRVADLAEWPVGLFGNTDLVTASALFDLVSDEWLERFATRLADSGAAALLAMTVDGRRCLLDSAGRALDDAVDRRMAERFNRHQRRAKGLGEALGPTAVERLPEVLRAAGMRVTSERADWRLSAGQDHTRRLGAALLDDWARAAAEQAPDHRAETHAWYRSRRQSLQSGALGLAVGHMDVLALPK